MATIDQIISTIPDAGRRGVDARTLFVSKQEAFQDTLIGIFVPQINTFRIEANLLASEVNVLRGGTLALRNETENIRNLANVQTQEQVALATTQAGVATTKASEANTSANQALTYKNQLQGYVIPVGTSYSVDQINTQNSTMTKAQFNALAEERKANRAGSGFDSFGKHNITIATNTPVNEGMWTVPTIANQFILGSESSNVGVSVTQVPNIIINGIKHTINRVNNSVPFSPNVLQLPTAPTIYPYDTVLTAEQIASGVIKHADASNSGLIVNGKFDVDVSGWSVYNSGTIVFSTNKALITSGGTNYGGASQSLSGLYIGKKYILTFEVSSSIGNRAITITNSDKSSGIIQGSTNGVFTIEFTPTASSCSIIFQGATSTTFSGLFDNIAVYPADAISRSDLVFLELTTSNAA